MRRQFTLPEADETMLTGCGLAWETVQDGGSQWLFVRGMPVPPGYNFAHVDVAISISAGYPDAGLDMAFFLPHLARADGKPIGALTVMVIDSLSWQRWSRHRTAQNPWRPGVDDISTHLGLVRHWLAREFELR